MPLPALSADHIEMLERKRTFTKVVKVDGTVVARYTRIPKLPIPWHPMVNDENQDLCGGWFAFDPLQEDFFIFTQALEGLKPAGSLHAASRDSCEIWKKALTKAGFNCSIRAGAIDGFELVFAKKGTPDMVFGVAYLNAVEDYYVRCVPFLAQELREAFKAYRAGGWLIDRFTPGWASPDGLEVVTLGLTLGYPIENTVALLLR